MQPPDYVVRSTTTATFGRVLLNTRDHHVVVDGPARNGCPGEALTPVELFLGGVVACAAELVQVVAREQNLPLTGLDAEIAGSIDRAHDVRADVTVFRSVTLRFAFRGVDQGQARTLVEAFKGR